MEPTEIGEPVTTEGVGVSADAQTSASRQAPSVTEAGFDHHGGRQSPLLFDTPPRPGESMGSWLLRLSHLNAFRTIGEFLFSHRIMGKTQNITDHPVDIPSTIRRLVVECGADAISAKAMLLTNDIAALSNTIGQKRSNWVNAKGMLHSICPECVTEGGDDPSWQRLWRISTTTHCGAHHRVLLDACPQCRQRFGIARSRSVRLGRCEECHADISAFTGRGKADPPPTRFGNATHGAPTAQPFPVGPVSRQDWWLGVNRLLLLISSPHIAAALLDLDLPDQYSIGLLQLSKGRTMPFRSHEAAQRARMLGFIEWLLSPWPDRFLTVMNTAVPKWPRLLSSELSPAWLTDLCLANALPKTPSQRQFRLRSRPCMVTGSNAPVRDTRGFAWPEGAADGRPSSKTLALPPLQLQLSL